MRNVQQKLSIARGEQPAELLFKNAKLVNVLSGEIYPANVAVDDGRVVGIGDYKAKRVIDLRGAYLAPSLVYVIRDAKTGRIYHFGETGRGFEVRGREWVRQLEKRYGLDTRVEFLQTVQGKAAAKALDTRYIQTYEKIYGSKPGFVDANGTFIQVQKTAH